MSKKAQWCDRSLVVSPLYFYLCLSEKDFKRQLRKLKIRKRHWGAFVSSGAWATTHYFTATKSHKECSIVCLRASKNHTLAQHHALLVHEATHLWQRIREIIGERYPSSEFEAYAIQNLSYELFTSYREQTKGKR